MGGGGMLATTEDNLRLMKLYADGGVWEGERILAEDYVRLATTNQNDSSTEALNNPEASDNFLGYGFQIWMCKPKGVYRADGAMGQFTIVSPEQDLLIAINETAVGAHWAQSTLNITWDFLEKVGGGTSAKCWAAGAENAVPQSPKSGIPAAQSHCFKNQRQNIHGSKRRAEYGNIQLYVRRTRQSNNGFFVRVRQLWMYMECKWPKWHTGRSNRHKWLPFYKSGRQGGRSDAAACL